MLNMDVLELFLDRFGIIQSQRPTTTTVSPTTLLFLVPDYWLIGYSCGNVFLYRDQQLVWTWSLSGSISCARPVGQSFVLLGGSRGTIWLVDWTHSRQAAAFSNVGTRRPSILFCVPTRPLLINKHNHPDTLSWSTRIQAMTVDSAILGKKLCQKTLGNWRIWFVTAAGWMCSLEWWTSKVEIHYAPPKIKLLTSKGKVMTGPQVPHSVPSDPVLAQSVQSMLTWQSTPRATRTLRHVDNRVLDGEDVSNHQTTGGRKIAVHTDIIDFDRTTPVDTVNLGDAAQPIDVQYFDVEDRNPLQQIILTRDLSDHLCGSIGPTSNPTRTIFGMYNGTYWVHDPRSNVTESTLENPLVYGGDAVAAANTNTRDTRRSAVCSNLVPTSLHEEFCFLSKVYNA